MSYLHPEMPPVVRLTRNNTDDSVDWQLEGQSGAVVETYTTEEVAHPVDWWDDMAAALLSNESRAESAFDMIRLNAIGDWELIDDRGN